MPRATPTVWNLQEKVFHYRVPVWDRLVARAGSDYDLSVLGATDDGRPFGAHDDRDYVRDLPLEIRTVLGQEVNTWPGVRALAEAERPDVVLVNPNPRTTDCWSLPALVRGHGGVSIGWTKVRTQTRLPRAMLTVAKKRLFRRYELMAVYGTEARDELIELGYPADRIHVAQNTIDTDRIFGREAELRAHGERLRSERGLAERTVLLYMGQFVPKKRVADLVDAWPELRALDDRLVLVLVGAGPTHDAVRERAAQVDPDRIIVTGRVPEGDDYAWVAAADITIQCGAVGLAINQSLALGRPTVIADEIGSDAELIAHDVTGWRYAKGDPAALVASVGSVLADPERTQAIAAAGRARVQDTATIEHMVDALDGVILRGLAMTARQEGRAR